MRTARRSRTGRPGTSASPTRGRGSCRRCGERSRTVHLRVLREVQQGPRRGEDWRDWPYFAGDGAVRAPDGYYRILGRVDDVINVAGHRLGTKEIESASLTVPEVAEAAAVPVIDDIRGRAVEVYVSLKPGVEASDKMARKVTTAIETEIGKIARPKNVWIVPDMPKTRSGEDHSPGHRRRVQLHRRRRRHHPGQPRNRRRHPPPSPNRQSRQRRRPPRTLRHRTRRNPSLRHRDVERLPRPRTTAACGWVIWYLALSQGPDAPQPHAKPQPVGTVRNVTGDAWDDSMGPAWISFGEP